MDTFAASFAILSRKTSFAHFKHSCQKQITVPSLCLRFGKATIVLVCSLHLSQCILILFVFIKKSIHELYLFVCERNLTGQGPHYASGSTLTVSSRRCSKSFTRQQSESFLAKTKQARLTDTGHSVCKSFVL